VCRLAALAVVAAVGISGCGGTAHPAVCGQDGVAGPDLGSRLAFECRLEPLGVGPSGEVLNGDIFTVGAGPTTRLTRGLAWDFDPAWSPGGSRIVFSSTRGGAPNLYVMDASGAGVRRLTEALAWESAPAWSPDGRSIVFQSGRDGISGPLGAMRRHDSLFRVSADGGPVAGLAATSGYSGDAAWSPDGSRIAFVSDREGPVEIYLMSAGGGDVHRLTRGSGVAARPSWSPDGEEIAFDRAPTPYIHGQASLRIVRVRDGLERRLPAGGGYQPAWSPAGNWIAFVSDRDGHPDLYVAHPDGGGLRRLTGDGAPKFRPAWRPGGRG
jgi:Tol biopolymer transport system component